MLFLERKIYLKQLLITVLYILITSVISIAIYLTFANYVAINNLDFIEGLDSLSYLIYFIILLFLNKKIHLTNIRITTKRNYYYILVVVLLSVFYFLFSDIIFNYNYLFIDIIQKPNLKLVKYSFTQNTFIVLNSLILIPIFEELIFRKVILNSLLERKGTIISILFSSLLFSMIHITFYPFNFPLPAFINAFFIGIVLGIVYYKYGFKYSVLLHSCFNFLTIIINRHPSTYWDILIKLNFGFLYCTLILISLLIIIALIYLSKFLKD